MSKNISNEISLINQTNARIINLYCEWVKKRDMNYNEFLMYYILLEGSRTQKELSLRSHLIKQTVNNIIRSMMHDGYVVLKENPNNYREKIVELTEKGKEKAHQVVDEMIEIENRAVKRFGEDEIKKFGEYDVRFAKILEEEMK